MHAQRRADMCISIVILHCLRGVHVLCEALVASSVGLTAMINCTVKITTRGRLAVLASMYAREKKMMSVVWIIKCDQF